MNIYDLNKAWYEFKFENPDKVRAIHSDFYFYVVYLWNKLGQKDKIGLPTCVSMEALGIGSYNTYKKILYELVDFGFLKIVSESINQHQSKVVALSKSDKATDSTLNTAISISDKATDEPCDKATDKATDTIDRLLNKQINKLLNIDFSSFWNIYCKKKDLSKCKKKWAAISDDEKKTIIDVLPNYIRGTPDVKYRKNPLTWLNGQCWLDELPDRSEDTKIEIKPLPNNEY